MSEHVQTIVESPKRRMQRELAETRAAEHQLPVALTPMDMIGKALTQNASIETLEKLMALQERWEKNQARKAFDLAIADAKAKFRPIMKNRVVSHGAGKAQFRHEDLAEIERTIVPVLSEHGLSYRFRTTSPVNEPVTVTCIVSHRDGYSEENTLTAGPDNGPGRNSIQAIGSTVTYLQRYTLKAALGLAASNDDDGKGADAAAPISQEQLEKLQALIVEVGADIPNLCTVLKVAALPELSAKNFDLAMALLKAKRAAAKGAKP